MIDVPRPALLVVTLALVGFGIYALGGPAALAPGAGGSPPAPDGDVASVPAPEVADLDRSDRIERKSAEFERAGRIVDPDGFVNADNVSIRDLVGEKVILVEFWTYSCYNCQNTHPHVNDWYSTYRDDGLVVIGIHTPEFDFEKKPENVREAVQEANIEYPVVLDNDYRTWSAWDQKWWPARYLIGIDGFVRYYHPGEGAYDETERKIKELLAERRAVLNETGEAGLQADADGEEESG